jgi:hypothetical protein
LVLGFVEAAYGKTGDQRPQLAERIDAAAVTKFLGLEAGSDR